MIYIDKAKIEIVLLAMAAAIEIEGWRSEQDFDKPTLPYFTYKIIFDRPDQKDQEIRVKEDTVDETIYPETIHRYGNATVSLNFFGNDYDGLRSKADAAREFLEETPLWEENNLADQYYTDVQDRSIFLETKWEHRFGFDVKVEYLNSKSIETDSIDIEATLPTMQGQYT
jgi:hypothetical protein